MHTCIHTCIKPTYIRGDIHTFVCVCVYARSHIKSHTNIHSYVNTYTRNKAVGTILGLGGQKKNFF